MLNRRVGYFDLLRIIAIACVVLTHASAKFVTDYPSNSIDFILGNIFDSISRIGAPLFFMISGALILDENKKFNCKDKVIKFLLILLCWSLFYAVITHILLPLVFYKRAIDFEAFITACITGHFHLWYLWATIGLYLITPILKLFVNKQNSQYVLYFLILSFIVQNGLPFLVSVFNLLNLGALSNVLVSSLAYIKTNLNLDFVCGYLPYFILGWYVTNFNFTIPQKTLIYVLGIISLLLIIILVQCNPLSQDVFYDRRGLLVFICSLAVFILVRTLYKSNPLVEDKINLLSKLTFGVYVIHETILALISQVLLFSVFFVPVVWLVTLVLSFLVAFGLSKIPKLNKLINF